MEYIRRAIERARSTHRSSMPEISRNVDLPPRQVKQSPTLANVGAFEEIELSSSHLLARRIVTHNGGDHRSRPYDILRTQVLRLTTQNGWKVLGVTSPTPGCGKTLTAVNLSLSIARQPDQSVIMVDMDLQKPQLANCFGLEPLTDGVLALLTESATFQEVTVPVRVSGQRVMVLPTARTTQSSELMGSRAARDLLQNLRREFPTIIVDLPPMLSSDDVLAVLPQLDCVLLVAAVGLSTASEVEECVGHLRSSELLRLVVNKATEETFNFYYY